MLLQITFFSFKIKYSILCSTLCSGFVKHIRTIWMNNYRHQFVVHISESFLFSLIIRYTTAINKTLIVQKNVYKPQYLLQYQLIKKINWNTNLSLIELLQELHTSCLNGSGAGHLLSTI